MRVRLKKLLAIVISVVMVMLLAPDIRVSAAYINYGTTEVDTTVSDTYTIGSGGILVIKGTGKVTGNISIGAAEGKLIIENGGTAGTVNAYTGVINNSGSIENISLTSATLTNNSTGSVSDITANNATIENTGYIYRLDATSTALNNEGKIADYTASGGTCSVELSAGSEITTFSGAQNSGSSVKITSSEGAKLGTANIYTQYVDTDSAGTVEITGSLILYGENDIPSGLNLTINDDTKLTSDTGYASWSVSCDGKRYLLPAVTFSDKKISELYNTSTSVSNLDISEMYAGYGASDIAQAAQSFTLSNSGVGNMRCVITAIPDFVELYDSDGNKIVANGTGSTIPLEVNGESTITVKAVEGKAVASYSDNITIEKYTDVAASDADDTLVSTDNIAITMDVVRKQGEGTVSVSDVYYGESITPVPVSATNGTAGVTYKYKKKTAADDTFTSEVPVQAGDYTVQATFAMTDEYNAVTATDDFSILRKQGFGIISVPDIYYGDVLKASVSSSTNGTANVVIEYKVKNAGDDTYTTTAPTKTGEYTARATFAMTEGYFEATATTDFKISYLLAPANPYIVEGTQGNDSYYTSVVTIKPAEGYLISTSLDGTYTSDLKISKTTNDFYVYLKKIATGEKTGAIHISGMKVDKDAPVMLNVTTGEKMYGDQVLITITDDNLSKVLVNGEEVELKDHTAVLNLSSNLGEETYEIICVDDAGNTNKTVIVVAAEWMKNRTVPEGSMVRLSRDYSYKFGSGTWKVDGDGTEYAGGSTFYVGSDGEYSFSKVD